jgi:hypothetical protein
LLNQLKDTPIIGANKGGNKPAIIDSTNNDVAAYGPCRVEFADQHRAL